MANFKMKMGNKEITTPGPLRKDNPITNASGFTKAMQNQGSFSGVAKTALTNIGRNIWQTGRNILESGARGSIAYGSMEGHDNTFQKSMLVNQKAHNLARANKSIWEQDNPISG